MYNDILFNGSRQFVVSMVSQFDNRFAEVGVVFYLEDLKEVSEQTGDRIKFICSHKASAENQAHPCPPLGNRRRFLDSLNVSKKIELFFGIRRKSCESSYDAKQVGQ